MASGVPLHDSMMFEGLGFEGLGFEGLGNVDLGIAPTLPPGEQLRRARVACGLSLADIAQRTRVPERSLAAIERCDLAGFQARIYAVGSARSYARAVAVDEAMVVAAVGSAYRKMPSRAPYLDQPLPQRRRAMRPQLLYCFAGVMLFALFAFTVREALTRG